MKEEIEGREMQIGKSQSNNVYIIKVIKYLKRLEMGK